MSVVATLPDELAPSLRAAAEKLLAEVGEAPPRDPTTAPRPKRRNRCIVCGGTGPLGGHHSADGTVQWIHRHCHVKLHRRHGDGRCTA